MRLLACCGCLLTLMVSSTGLADEASLAEALRKVEPRVFTEEVRDRAGRMLGEYYSTRIRAGNARSTADWRSLQSLSDWERYRETKLKALRESLGTFPPVPNSAVTTVTKELAGDGFVIKCVLLESRPGIWISGNLYVPQPPRKSMPGFVISHSHHTSKTQGELQDMGMTWARLGGLVWVPDHMGHGERRQHPFSTERDYAGSFRVSRQDYYFRYDLAVQAHLAGESYVGQQVRDLSRGVDLLLSQKGIDAQRIALLGAVAGGGDPAAVTAALDTRITVAAPFNFGGPQPETIFPLPTDADASFNYAGSGSWESTRNLKGSIADGFLPWVIVGSIAPRRLVYGHEFAWDRERDPVWTRFNTIYGWHKSANGLSESHGFGSVKQADGSHCTHIGKLHRVAIHTALAQWFGIPDGAAAEYSQRRDSSELLCWTDEARERIKPRLWRDVLNEQVTQRLGMQRRRTATPPPEVSRANLQRVWAPLLFGNADVTVATNRATPEIGTGEKLGTTDELANVSVQRLVVESEPGIRVPSLLLKPTSSKSKPQVVLVLAQGGKGEILKQRAAEIAQLLNHGRAVLLLDPRGTGETSVGSDRDRGSEMTSRSSSHLMLGGTFIGSQLRDVQAVLAAWRQEQTVDWTKLAVWGDSTAPTNPRDAQLVVPHAIDRRPHVVEPTGQLLALILSLYDSSVSKVLVSNGLHSFQSVYDRPTVHVPHEVVIPNMLTLGDLSDFGSSYLPASAIKHVQTRSSGNQELSGVESLATGISWLRE